MSTRMLLLFVVCLTYALAQGQSADDAIAHYEKLAKATPASADAQYRLGEALRSAGRTHDAVEPLRRALTLNPALAAAADLLGVSLGETGRCSEALPLLRKALAHNIADAAVRKSVQVTGLRCGMTLSRTADTLAFIGGLTRDFPADPEVLYILTHAYSDLSMAASRDLLYKAPDSIEVHQLNAEALETQGKWAEAAAEYKRIIEKNPNVRGIHYRLGRLLLSQPESRDVTAEARKEFEAELKVDPLNAGAEFVLGELSRREGDYERAIEHFSRAVKYDRGFAAAHLGLGKSLLGASRPADAIAPLQTAVKLDPNEPEGHFQLSLAYRRQGNNEAANREAAIQKSLTDKARANTEEVQKKVLGIPQAQRPQ